MAEKAQSLSNHARFDPLFHFFVLPVFGLTWVIAIVDLFRHPGIWTAWTVVFLSAAVAAVFKIRLYALRVQDRVIRLEEKLRLSTLLDDPLRARIGELTEGQLIGLRFASDGELPALVTKALDQKLSRADVKRGVQVWRADYWRV
jgi:Family of unknown function (DUF6526)